MRFASLVGDPWLLDVTGELEASPCFDDNIAEEERDPWDKDDFIVGLGLGAVEVAFFGVP